tara:strand:- start:452 stop:1387 length:936 start_codon:yes stop_codon:yes gene_type:complete
MAFNVITGTVGTVGNVTFGSNEGSITITGSFAGNGENLTEVPRMTNAVNNGIITNVGGDANTHTCESNLLFDGSTLDVTGHVTASQGISGSYVLASDAQLRGLGVLGDIAVTGALNLTGTVTVDGHMVPTTANIHDLGTSDKPWRNLYVSSSTIYFGNESLSVEDNNLKFGSGSTTKGLDVGFMNFKNNGIFMDPGRIFQLRAYQMQFYGGVAYVRKVVANDYNILKIDYLVGVATDLLTASVKLTLPPAANCVNGQTYIIKDEGGAAHTRNINVSASASDTIDGINEVVLESPYGALSLYCNGNNKWYVF